MVAGVIEQGTMYFASHLTRVADGVNSGSAAAL